MFCNKCGAKAGDNQKFCASCGNELGPRLVGALKPSESMPVNAKPVSWASRRMKIGIWVVVVLFLVIPILSAIVLASLNAARQKATGATSEIQEDGWQTYNSVADKFSILFPEYPTYETDTDTTAELPYTYNTYTAVKDGSSYMVVRYVYHDEIDISDPDRLLEGFLNGFVNGAEGEILSSFYTYSNNYRALGFHATITDSEYVKGRFILVGQSIFLIAKDYFTQNYNETDYQKFINSFSVK